MRHLLSGVILSCLSVPNQIIDRERESVHGSCIYASSFFVDRERDLDHVFVCVLSERKAKGVQACLFGVVAVDLWAYVANTVS